MADVKTILRETSVILGLFNVDHKSIDADKYVELLKKYISNRDDITEELSKITPEVYKRESLIIHNGCVLGGVLLRHFGKIDEVQWVGAKTKSQYPHDIIVNGKGVSLKEKSFILKNPALGEYLNTLTQISPPFETVHVFRHFSPNELNDWFNYTYNRLISQEDGVLIEDKKRGYRLEKSKDLLIVYDKGVETVSVKIDSIKNELDFNKKLGGDYFENLFSKWVNKFLKKDNEYKELKKKCSETAGVKLIEFIKSKINVNKSKLLELLQIYKEDYIYAKVGTPLLRVPKMSEVEIKLVNAKSSVPQSQLNILLDFQLKTNDNKTIVSFRVECRYSHGQFKGVPEAKLYYVDNDQINNLYSQL